MARTKAQIKTEIETEKAALLSALAGTSAFAVYTLIINVVAAAIYTFEVLLDAHKKEVEAAVVLSTHGNLAWYHAQSFKFQYNFALLLDKNTYVYYYTDTTSATAVASRIITQTAVVASEGDILFKVAKGAAGSQTKLNATELTAFNTYLQRIGLAGDVVGAVSYEADLIRLKIKLYYDGQLEVTALQVLVEAAIADYFMSLDFNGQVNTNDLIEKIKEVAGVFDVEFSSKEIKAEVGGYEAFTRTADGLSGYYKLTDVGTTIDDTTIQFIAQ